MQKDSVYTSSTYMHLDAKETVYIHQVHTYENIDVPLTSKCHSDFQITEIHN